MQHEKIIKRPDGKTIKILVTGKTELSDHARLATAAEILSAKLEIWQKLKPV